MPKAFFLLKADGKRVSAVMGPMIEASSGNFMTDRIITCEATGVAPLPSGQPYTLDCCTFDEGQESSFTVTVYSSAPLDEKYLEPGSKTLKRVSESVPVFVYKRKKKKMGRR